MSLNRYLPMIVEKFNTMNIEDLVKVMACMIAHYELPTSLGFTEDQKELFVLFNSLDPEELRSLSEIMEKMANDRR